VRSQWRHYQEVRTLCSLDRIVQFTENANRSLENAVLIEDCETSAYYREWERILALSEPLDWESEWGAPEWRIGS
jgi:hypothetical protein